MNTKERPPMSKTGTQSLKYCPEIEANLIQKNDGSLLMPKVLAVDDDCSIHLVAEKALTPIADVFTADTAERGLALVRQHDCRLPVIFMTVEATSQTAIEAMQLGAFDYLAKPSSVDPLRDLVEKAIVQRKISSVPVAIAAEDDGADGSSKLFIGRSGSMLDVFKVIG